MSDSPLALEVRGVTKTFPGVIANEDVDLTLHEGKVLCVLGENGAGKSTLMNTVFGLYQPDAGEIRLRGEPVRFGSSRDAIAVPSTRALIFANAASREVETSSPKGEKPQSSVEPRCAGSTYFAASRMRSRTCAAVSMRGSMGSVTPTKIRRFFVAVAWDPRISSTRARSFSLESWTKKLSTCSRKSAGRSSA